MSKANKGQGKQNFKPMNKDGNFRGKQKPAGKRPNLDSTNSRCGDSRDHRSGDSSDRLSPLNDMSWYDRNPLLTQGAASVPYPYKPGMKLDFGNPTIPSYMIPGVMTLNWEPTIGYCTEATDPASIAAKEIYAKVRSAFSGSLDADAPDFVVYLMALDSIFAYIGSLKRVYRILNAYTSMNYLIPDTLLLGMGLNSNSVNALRANRMQLFQIINELIGMTQKFMCPAVFDVFNRHYWLNDNVYADDASVNSQMYVFVQTGYYMFTLQKTPAGVDAGGLAIESSPLNSGSDITVEGLFTYGQNLINALANSDDAYTISGYLTRAYADASVFSVSPLLADEQFNPVFVPEVLAQIENAWAISAFDGAGYGGNVVSQDPTTNTLICKPSFTSVSGGSIKPIINVRRDVPTLADTVEATRLKCYVDEQLRIICGTEILTTIEVTMNQSSSLGYVSVDQFTTIDIETPTTAGGLQAWIDLCLGSFDWHPFVLIRFFNKTATPVLVGDIHNVTVIELEQLKQINRICLYSEFNSFNLK